MFCPYCREHVAPEDTECPFCGKETCEYGDYIEMIHKVYEIMEVTP